MMIPTKLHRQESFVNGELDPSLYASFSMEAYKRGLRTCRNWVITKYGTLLNRSGTKLLASTLGGGAARLIPFDFSDEQAYMLEFTDGYLRVFGQDGTSKTLAVPTYVGLGATAAVRSSDGGGAWGAITPPTGTFMAVAIKPDESLAVAVGPSVCATSTDKGASWTLRTIATGGYNDVCWTGTRWVAVGVGGLFAHSTDGINWTDGSNDVAVNWQGVAANGGTVCAVGEGNANNEVYTSKSTDHGQTWAAKVTVGSALGYSQGIVFTGTHFVLDTNKTLVAGVSAPHTIYRSTDAATWSTTVTLNSTDYGIGAICSRGAKIFLSVSNCSYLSNDHGVTWRTLDGGAFKDGVTLGPYKELIGWQAYGSSPVEISLDDGVTWTHVAGLSVNLYCGLYASGTATSMAVPYQDTHLSRLRSKQSGDVMTITHQSYSPSKLTRGIVGSNPVFTLSDYYQEAPSAKVTSLVLSGHDTTGDADHPLRPWSYVITWEDAGGVESLPSNPVSATMARGPDRQATLTFTGVYGASRYNVYAGRNGEYGYIGSCLASPYNDDGSIPILSYDPPKWENPFSVDWPALSIVHEDRVAFANTPLLPATVRWSSTSEYQDFDESTVQKDEDAFKRTLATLRYEEIRAMLVIGELLLFTSESEWTASGNGNPISYVNLTATAHAHNGSSWVHPLVINKEALFVQSNGNEVRNFFKGSDGWDSDELSMLVNHLFKGRTIVSWAHARRPHDQIWIVLSDGKLLSLTYDRKLGVVGWARHDTGIDYYKDVAVIPNQGRDEPWFVVQRGATYYIEIMQDRHNVTASTFCGVDGAVSVAGLTVAVGGTLTVTGLGHLEGRSVKALVDGKVRSATVSSGSAAFTSLTPGVVTAGWAGLPITSELETLDYPDGKTLEKMVGLISIETSGEEIPPDSSAGIEAGEDLNHGSSVPFSTLRQGLIEVIPSTEFNPGARCAVRLTDPVPLEIRGITRHIELGR